MSDLEKVTKETEKIVSLIKTNLTDEAENAIAKHVTSFVSEAFYKRQNSSIKNYLFEFTKSDVKSLQKNIKFIQNTLGDADAVVNDYVSGTDVVIEDYVSGAARS